MCSTEIKTGAEGSRQETLSKAAQGSRGMKGLRGQTRDSVVFRVRAAVTELGGLVERAMVGH